MNHTIRHMALLIILLVLSLICVACRKSSEQRAFVIGATPAPHADILKEAANRLADEGIQIDIREFSDYTALNPACESGDLDANYFQHLLYLKDYNEKQKGRLKVAQVIHYEPFGLYPGQTSRLDHLKEGAQIGIPNDASNEARALLLLEQAGLIQLKKGAGVLAGLQDVVSNPLKLKLIELAAEQIPRALKDLDLAVINGNYAIQAGLKVKRDALVIESDQGEAVQVYANAIVTREDDLNRPELKALIRVLKSPEMVKWIEEKYEGSVQVFP